MKTEEKKYDEFIDFFLNTNKNDENYQPWGRESDRDKERKAKPCISTTHTWLFLFLSWG